MRGRLAAALLMAALLAGCATHKPRPGKPEQAPAVTPAKPDQAAAVPDDGRPHDDLQLPQSERYALNHDTGPLLPPEAIAKLPEPVPHPEPRSRYGNKSPYRVRGRTYHVLKDALSYDQRGIASWYGAKFHGYLTSSLEPYDMYKFSAASKVLPLPTWARVTNLENGKSVIVRVNDRGPFVSGRIIDLSYAAAVRIGIWPKGTGLVEVRAIDPAHPEELQPPAAVTAHGDQPRIWLQIGAFADAENAARMAKRLQRAHLAAVQVQAVTMNGHVVRRVRLGPLENVEQADRLSGEIVRLGLPQPRVTVD